MADDQNGTVRMSSNSLQLKRQRVALDSSLMSTRLCGDNVAPVYFQIQSDEVVAESKTVINAKPMTISRSLFNVKSAPHQKAHLKRNKKSNPLVTLSSKTQGNKEMVVFMVKRIGSDNVEFLLRFTESSMVVEPPTTLKGKLDAISRAASPSEGFTAMTGQRKRVITITTLDQPEQEWRQKYEDVKNSMMNSKKLVKASIRGQIDLEDAEFNSSTCTMALSTSVPEGTEIDDDRVSSISSMTSHLRENTSALTTARGKQDGLQLPTTISGTLKSFVGTGKLVPKKKRAETFLPAAPLTMASSSALGVKHTTSGTLLAEERHLAQQRPTQHFDSGKANIALQQDLMLASFFELLFELVDNFDRSQEIGSLTRQRILQELKTAPKATEFEEKHCLHGEQLDKSMEWHRVQGTMKDHVESFYMTKPDPLQPWLNKTIGKRSIMIDESLDEIFAGIYDTTSAANLKRFSKENPNCFFYSKDIPRSRGKFLHFALKIPLIKQHVFSCFMTYKMYTDPVSGRKKCVIVAIPKSKYDVDGDLDGGTFTMLHKREKIKEHGYLHGDMTYVYLLEAHAPRFTHLSLVVDVNFDSSCPKTATKKKLDQILSSVNQLQMQYERNRTVVDDEVLAYLKQRYQDPSTVAKLLKHSKDQTKLVDRAFEVQKSILEGQWNFVAPYSTPDHQFPLVDIKVKENEEAPTRTAITRDGRYVYARAKCTFDVTPVEAAAFFFNRKSYFHRDTFDEKNKDLLHTGQTTVKSNGLNDQIVACVDSDPLSRAWRQEFVLRQVLGFEKDDGAYYVAMESVDDDVSIDYGFATLMKMRITRVRGRMLFIAEPDEKYDDRCTVTLLQQLDLGSGILRTSKMETISMSRHLRIFGEMRERLNRDDDIVSESISNLAEKMRNSKTTHSGVQLSLLEDVNKSYKRTSQTTGGWRPIRSPYKHVKMHTAQLPGESNYVGRATVVVDADIFTCAAWEWDKFSRLSLKSFYDGKGIKREIETVDEHQLNYRLSTAFAVKELAARFFDMLAVWKVEKNSDGEPMAIQICYRSTNHGRPIPDGHPRHAIRASSFTFWKFEKVKGRTGIPQTKVTRATQVNLGGFIPVSIVNKESMKQFGSLEKFRQMFDKSKQLNRMAREEFATSVWSMRDGSYSNLEKEIIRSGITLFEAYENSTQVGQVHSKKHSSAVESITIKGHGYRWGISSSNIRANIVDVLEYLWEDVERREMETDNLEYRIVEEVNSYHRIIYQRLYLGSTSNPIDFLMTCVWKMVDKDTILISSVPHLKNGRVNGKNKEFRGKQFLCYKMTRIDENNTLLETLYKPSNFGRAWNSVVTKVVLKNLRTTTETARHFLAQLGMETTFKDDGALIGEELNVRMSEGGVDHVLRSFDEFQVLKELEEKYPNIKYMVKSIMLNVVTSDDTSKLLEVKHFNMSASQAMMIGSSLASTALTTTSGRVAVKEWFFKFKLLKAIARDTPWSRGLLETVAQRLMDELGIGLKFRLILNAFLSVLTFVADVVMAITLLSRGGALGTYGAALLACAILNVLSQVLLFVVMNFVLLASSSWLTRTRLLLPILFWVKPITDTILVLKERKGLGESGIRMLGFDRINQMFFQGIPARVILAYMLLAEPGVGSLVASCFVTLSISCIATASLSSSVNYELDCSPRTRREDKHFSNYIPLESSRRLYLFLVMFFQALFHSALRSLACALLFHSGLSLFLLVSATDIFISVVAKALQGDIDFGAPVAGYFGVSVLIRAAMKVLTDHSRMVELHHPRAMGGLLWTVNDSLTVPFAFLCFIISSASSSGVPHSDVVLPLLTVSSAGWVLCSGLFISLLAENKFKIFLDRTTFKQYCKRKFFSLESSDENKAEWTLMTNPNVWRSFRSDVRDWCLENWVDWEYDAPSWFKIVDGHYRVPPDFIPKLDALDKKRDTHKRRSSMSVRMGAKRATVKFPSIYKKAEAEAKDIGSVKFKVAAVQPVSK